VVQFLKDTIFARFGTPRAIISDGGKHFCNRVFEQMMKKYCITYMVATPYHPQTSGGFKQRDQEDFREDGEPVKERLVSPVERCIIGIPDSVQDTDWHVTLPYRVRESMPSACGVGAQSLLGH
jgi:hypothetical protein